MLSRSPCVSVLVALSALALSACTGKEAEEDSGPPPLADADVDGYTTDVDCDDNDPEVHPNVTEVCDGFDNNCDGLIDDADPDVDLTGAATWLADDDGDGYGDDDAPQVACELPAGHVAEGGDCDDDNPEVNPGVPEVCDDDNVDEDCSGSADNEDPDFDPLTGTAWFPDTDGDGFGDSALEGSVYCDDPSTSEETWLADNTDCDDTDSAVNPAATEVCDELDVDEDCDGLPDDADDSVDPDTRSLFYVDGDGDGFGSFTDPGSFACDLSSGFATDNTDCNDGSAAIHPDATEICDELDVDEDCDGTSDDADDSVDPASQTLYYADSDSDGYGSATDSGTLACSAPAGSVADNTDCDDDDGDVNPDATETCDGIDNDCDSATSEAGLATLVDSSGTVTDATATLTGTAGSPAVVSLTTAGSLAVCEGTWYVQLDVAADLELWNPSGIPADVVLDGDATGTVISIATDGIAVDLYGLSVENGLGTGNAAWDSPGVSGGGIDCTATGTTLTASALDLQANAATGVGGGLGVHGCDVTIEDAVISDNTATLGGGLYVDSGHLSLTDSVVSDNTSSTYGGGLVVHDSASAGTADLREVDVRDNTADTGAGAYLWSLGDGVELSCTGSTSTTAGFTSNTATTAGGGVSMSGSVQLEADSCDFGTSDGADDNSPEDISGTTSYTYDDDETFLCVDGYCGTDSTYTVGSASATSTDTEYLAGDVILADTDALLRSFGVTLSTTASCTADFYVLSGGSGETSGWTVLYANTGVAVSSSAAYVDSGLVNAITTSGTYYALVAGTTCSASGLRLSYGAMSSSTTDAGFGTLTGNVYTSAYTSALTEGEAVTFDSWSDTYAIDTEVVLLER